MTLHETTEFAKKFGVGSGIGVGVIITLVIIFRIGVFVEHVIFPDKIAPANVAYGKIPQIQFPQNSMDGTFTYTLNTVDGNLPTTFPDRLVIYKMLQPQSDLNNLVSIKNIVNAMGFQDSTGNTVPEISRGGSTYEWDDPTGPGLQRKIIYDTTTLNFDMSSNYLTLNDVLSGKNLGDATAAFTTAQTFLSTIYSPPDDINPTLTTAPDPANDYTVVPQLYSIDSTNGKLVKTTSLQDARVIRVDFYQNAIEYKIQAGTGGDLSHFQDFAESLPIMYPNPPFSTMDFYVASGPDQAHVMQAKYYHQKVDLSSNAPAADGSSQQATYPIKSAQQAFDDLKSGKGYIAAYNGTDTQVQINKVYLGYYIGEQTQSYLMPVVVFEGSNGFFAYVSAVTDDALN